MRRAAALLAAFNVAVAGCSDPASSKLKPGQSVLVHDEKYDKLYVKSEGDLVPVPVGGKLRIAKDDGTADDRYRDVAVIIDEGPKQGTAGTMRRSDLRPMK